MKPVYDVIAGRVITCNGVPFVAIHKCDGTSPVEADDWTHEVVTALTHHDELVRIAKIILMRFPDLGTDKSVNGADAVDLLNEIYLDLARVISKVENSHGH